MPLAPGMCAGFRAGSGDAHQLAKIAEQGEMGIGTAFIRRDCLLTQSLAFLKMGQPSGAIRGKPALMALFKCLYWQCLS